MRKNETPAGLVAIAWAGWQTGDQSLVRTAVHLLRTRFGVRISFPPRPKAAPGKGGAR